MLAMERRLGGAVSEGPEVRKDASSAPASLAEARRPPDESGAGAGDNALAALLHPMATPAARARVLPAERLLLPKGAFIDCTLETAIDSTLPGMTTCITATDTYSADGTVVLLERGTKLVGETRGQVQQGTSRIFVLWNEARTPTGVVVPLSSPGTDELGRSGLTGDVNRHFWDRFGAAILLTVINGAVQGAVNSQNSGGSVVVSPTTSTDVMTEVLRGTLSIPPTITKAQGDRIQVFVARDVDFRPVYALRIVNASASSEGTP
jgi:type IV secretion system protein VirB10